jgi:hypothetical protein
MTDDKERKKGRKRPDASDVTQEEFDKALEAILDDASGSELLAIPGLYEVVSEHFNNEAIDLAREEKEENNG